MNACVLVEREEVLALLRAILPSHLQKATAFTVRGGNNTSLARSLLSTRQVPLAVLVETHSLDRSIIHERGREREDWIKFSTAAVPVKVIVLVPEMEVVFFQATGLIERIFGQPPSHELALLARFSPQTALAELCRRPGAPGDLATLLDRLSPEDIEALRATEPLHELSTFLDQAARPSARPARA